MFATSLRPFSFATLPRVQTAEWQVFLAVHYASETLVTHWLPGKLTQRTQESLAASREAKATHDEAVIS